MRDRVDQDELDYDTQQGRWAEDKPSIFDHFEDDQEFKPMSKEFSDELDKILGYK